VGCHKDNRKGSIAVSVSYPLLDCSIVHIEDPKHSLYDNFFQSYNHIKCCFCIPGQVDCDCDMTRPGQKARENLFIKISL
jgi:hypothetical protein